MMEPSSTEEEMELSPQEIGKRAVKSVGALFSLRIFIKLITRIRTFLVIPFLIASDFGLARLSLSIIAFAGLPMLGFGKNIFTEKKDIEQLYSVHTTFKFGFTFIFGFVIIILRHFIANLFGEPLLSEILLVMISVNIFNSLGSGAQVKLRREIRQNIAAIVESFSNGIDLVITVYFAISGYGVWSLVYGLMAGQIVTTILFLAITRIPSKRFNKTHIVRYLRGGINYNILEIVVVALANITTLIVGFFTGVNNLGYYTIALGIAMLLESIIVHPISFVTFPAYARMDSKTLKIGLQRTIEFTSISLFSGSLIGIFSIKFLIIFFFGEEWLPVAPLAQIALVLALISGLLAAPSSYLLAEKKTKFLTFMNLIRIGILFTIGIPLTFYFGSMGMIITQILHTSAALFATGKVVSKQFGVNLLKESLYPATIALFLTASIVSVFSYLFNLNSLGSVILIILIYGFTIALTGREAVVAISKLIKKSFFTSGE